MADNNIIAINKNINNHQSQQTNADSLAEKHKRGHYELRQEEAPWCGLSSLEG